MSGAASATPLRGVGVLGGGPWGVALALAAARTGADVVLHSRREVPQGHRPLRTTTDFADLATRALVIVAVPSDVVRDVARKLGDHLSGQHLVVHGIRGLSHEDAADPGGPNGATGLETVSDILRQETQVRRCGALGGPVQANELLEGRPSAMVVGSHFPEVIGAVRKHFASSKLRVIGTPDLEGLEWASALVGCLAIGVGFAREASAGPGLIAALISAAIDEAGRVMAIAGADPATMHGLGGVGDLLASIAQADRPEVVIGTLLGRGVGLEEAVREAKLRVEAIQLIPKIRAFAAEHHVPAPTFDALSDLLRGERPDVLLGRLFAA